MEILQKTINQKTLLVIDRMIDEPVQEAPSNKNLSVVDQLRATFIKPGKYVLDCATMTDEDWSNLYPPIAKEYSKLPGSGLPEWTGQWNYCIRCHSVLRDCASNPYGFKGVIGKSRAEVALRNRLERANIQVSQPTTTTTEVTDEVTGEVTTVTTSDAPKTRAAHGTYKQIMPPENQQDIRNQYLAGATINGLSEEFKIAAKAVRDFLAEEGILRKPGEKLFKVEPKPQVVKEASTEPPARRGKLRTTLVITDAILTKATKMLASGCGMVEIAKAENLNASELSVALKASGVVITKGATKGNFGSGASTSHAHRVRSTELVTEQLVKKVAKMLRKGIGGGLVAIAKAENVNPNELSVALKSAGVVILRGRKKV